jgi:hypothetical protein
MIRSRSIFFLCLSALMFLVACRNEAGQVPPSAESTATATAAAARGEESDEPPASLPATRRPAAEATSGGTAGLIYSVPFEVRPDGFSFRNYGAGHPEGDFTVADLRELFGDGVCSRIDADRDVCIPTAEAQQWIADRNADMSVGHCIGFTVAGYRFAQGDLQPDMFAPDASVPYDIERRAPIMRTIAANGSLYWVKSVWSSEVSGTPRDIIDALIELGEPVDLSIYLPGLVGGHSLLAYGVTEVAPQQYHILVYDNNFPGEPAFVEVDYAANTWRYDQGAINPDVVAMPYEGDAQTETLRFIPLTAYDQATCPFCPAETEAEELEAFTLLSFLGQGDVLVETALGVIGSVAGEIINEIPGARLIFPRGQLAANDAPNIVLPAGIDDYTIRFSGLRRVSSLSPGQSVVLDQLAPTADENQLAVTSSTQNIDFQAGGEQSPALKATIRQDQSTLSVALLGVDFVSGQSLALGASKESGRLEITSPNAEISAATLLILRLSKESEEIFATTALDVNDGGGVALDVAGWDGQGDIDTYLDEDGDGTFEEEPTTLPNEPLTQVIRQTDSATVSNVVDNVNPYLGEDGLMTLLVGLADQELSGREIGAILLPLHLPADQLISLIATYDLPLPELAELLFALRLEAEKLEEIIAGLEMAEEDEEALRDTLDNLALYHEIIVDWEFLNTDEMARLAGLLNERALTVEQLGQLLPRMELTPAQLEQLLPGLALSPDDLAALAKLLEIDLPETPESAPIAATGTATATATPSPTATRTPTATSTPTATRTPTPLATPSATATLDPYPPAPTGTPDPYPYPGPSPSPGSYPGPTSTPEYKSFAYCSGDELRIVAQEPTWLEATVEIWSGDELLYTGTTGPGGESFEAAIPGPGTWPNLYLQASVAPTRVPLGTISCP